MNAKITPKRIGNIFGDDRGTGFAGNIWNKEWIAPTVTTCGGGYREPMIMEIIYEDRRDDMPE